MTLAIPGQVPTRPKPIPPLQNGDRLTRDEFERRYHAMPAHVKAELVEGVVYMPSPVKEPSHAQPHFDLIGWLFTYRAVTPNVVGGDNGTLRLDLDNEPQPDAYLRIKPEYGGAARIGDDGYVVGAPELVAEVAASSASYDLHAKLHAYRRNGVREYIVWRTLDEQIDWFVLRGGRYESLAASDGLLHSEVFPGLWLDPVSMASGDVVTVLRRLQEGVASPEHDAFVARLTAKRS